MPVKLGSKLPEQHEARIEIIPLIDIMFFLLAAFMLVSLSMVNLKSVKVTLPTATAATVEPERNFANISVDRAGLVFLDGQPAGPNELAATLAGRLQANRDLRVLISGDAGVNFGKVMQTLDLVRSTGIENVAFEIRTTAKPTTP